MISRERAQEVLALTPAYKDLSYAFSFRPQSGFNIPDERGLTEDEAKEMIDLWEANTDLQGFRDVIEAIAEGRELKRAGVIA